MAKMATPSQGDAADVTSGEFPDHDLAGDGGESVKEASVMDMFAAIMAQGEGLRSEMAAQSEGLRSEMTAQVQKNCETLRSEVAAQGEGLRSDMAALQKGLQVVREQAAQYTREVCGAIKEELEASVEAVKEELGASVDAVKEEMEASVGAVKEEIEACRDEFVALQQVVRLQTSAIMEQHALPGPAMDEPPGKAWSEPGDDRSWQPGRLGGGKGGVLLPPLPPVSRSPPRCLSPPAFVAPGPASPPPACHTPRCYHTPPASPAHRKKPADFDGKVAWEAYLAQFELLADAQGWSTSERTLQLVSSLRGPALEVLGHLTPAQRLVYASVVEALRRKFGHHQQADVYRARLKARVRARGETLPQLALEVETLVRRAYPAAPEDMVSVLARDHFLDALQDRDLQLYVKQAHPGDVQEALARALELEAFLRTARSVGAAELPRRAPHTRELTVRQAQVKKAAGKKHVASGRTSPTGFRGSCWSCGQQGHKRSQCAGGKRTRSLERPAGTAFQPCCRSCGQYGHFSVACTNPKDVVQMGNDSGLGRGAQDQPAPLWPRAE